MCLFLCKTTQVYHKINEVLKQILFESDVLNLKNVVGVLKQICAPHPSESTSLLLDSPDSCSDVRTLLQAPKNNSLRPIQMVLPSS